MYFIYKCFKSVLYEDEFSSIHRRIKGQNNSIFTAPDAVANKIRYAAFS